MKTITESRLRRLPALLVLCGTAACTFAHAQQPRNYVDPGASHAVVYDQPDAQRTKTQLSALLNRFPPSLRGVLALDPGLLANQSYLAPYPALAGFLNSHPEVVRDPSFFVGASDRRVYRQDTSNLNGDLPRRMFDATAIFAAFGLAIGLIAWLIRTTLDYRRWQRLASVQTDVHTKLLDRFTSNEDLLAYIQSPAGAKFLESSPITLDAAPRSVGAPLGRILWSVQAGLVLFAAGVGFEMVSTQASPDAVQPLHAIGVLGGAIGAGFVVSAIISFVISRHLGLIEQPARRIASPGAPE